MTIGSNGLQGVVSIGLTAVICGALLSCGGPVGSPGESAGKAPDLVVTSPTVSDSGPAAGAGFTLSATVGNAGDGASEATTLRYYRSTDATITTSDTQVGTDEVPGLAPSGTSTPSVSLTAPSTPATYYYGACVDAVTDEADTANNCSDSVTVTVQAPVAQPQERQDQQDLVVTSPTVSDGGPAPGARFTLSAKVTNGGGAAAAATTLRYYRSADATITTSDREVGENTVAELAAAGSSSQSVELTAPETPGTYYYGACVDAVADESDTTNNCSLSVQVTVQVTMTPPRGNPDLIVTSVEVSDSGPEAEAIFTLSAAVENAGEGKSAATALRFYRSADTTITATDTWVRTVTIAGLAGSGSSSHSVELTAPSSPGRYYYGSCVDAVPGESDTTNNCSRARTVRVVEGPDLVVGGPFVINGTPEAGGTFLLVVSVRNRGDATSAATTVRHYRSTDATLTSADTLEGTEEVPPLVSLQSFGKQIYLTAPSTAGTYYYGSCVDAVPGESDTTNNCSESREVTVSEPGQSAPSVEISVDDGKEWAPVGDTVDLSARVLDEEGEEVTGTTVTWSSSNIAVATVDSSGVMTAVGAGTVTLTATATATGFFPTQSSARRSAAAGSRVSGAAAKQAGTVSGSFRMTCVPRAARVEITPDSVSLDEVGATARLTATVYDAGDNEIQPAHWRWSSADPAVATVRARAGVRPWANVTAVGAGTTTVTLIANGSATGTATVAVTLLRGRVAVRPRSLTFDAFWQTRPLTVRVLDGNGDEDEDASFSYSVWSGFTAGTLDIEKRDDGLQITAKGTGSGSITITSPGVEPATVAVTVFQEPATLVVSPDSVSLTVGDTAALGARVMDANGHDIQLAGGDQRGRVVYWTTDDEEVATVAGEEVDRPGNRGAAATVTAAAAGTATITATTLTLDGTGLVSVVDEATVTVTR